MKYLYFILIIAALFIGLYILNNRDSDGLRTRTEQIKMRRAVIEAIE